MVVGRAIDVKLGDSWISLVPNQCLAKISLLRQLRLVEIKPLHPVGISTAELRTAPEIVALSLCR